MAELMAATALEQVRIITPYVFGTICYTLFTWLICCITAVRVNRKWRREEEERLPEIAKCKLADRDRVIRSQRYQIEKKDETIKRLSIAIRAANMHNHKVSEILQIPLEGKPVIGRKAG